MPIIKSVDLRASTCFFALFLLLLITGCTTQNNRFKMAVEYGQTEEVKQLLFEGADANGISEGGNPILHYAYNGEIAELLLKHGAKLEARGNNGWTALHAAAHEGKLDVVKVLLKHGAKANALDDTGANALDSALLMNFRFYHPDVKAILKLLIEHGADIKRPCYFTALQYAAKYADLPFAKYAIEKGAQVNVVDNNGWTILFLAAASPKDDSAIIRYFISKGVPVNALDNNGDTALYWAIKKNHIKIAEELIKNGANPRIKNKAGATSVDLIYKKYPKTTSSNSLRKWVRILRN